MAHGLTDLERELLAELDTIAGIARQGERALKEGRATTGASALQRIRNHAADVARHVRALESAAPARELASRLRPLDHA